MEIKWVAIVDLSEVQRYIEGQVEGEPPRDALQVLDIVMRHGVSGKLAQREH